MSFYQRRIVPCLTHLAMRQKNLVPIRKRVVGAAQGRVLEIGVGSGLNFALYGAAVTSVIGLEPSPVMLRMARSRASNATVPISLLDASAERQDHSCLSRCGHDRCTEAQGSCCGIRRSESFDDAR